MDYLQEQLKSHLLSSAPLLTSTLNSTLLQTYTNTTHLRTTYLNPYIIDPLSTLLTTTSSLPLPDLTSLILLLLILFISLKILDYGRRLVFFWVNLALRILWWGALVGVGWYVYSVGVERAGRELGYFWGVGAGFVQGFVDGAGEGRESWRGSAGGSGGSARNYQVPL